MLLPVPLPGEIVTVADLEPRRSPDTFFRLEASGVGKRVSIRLPQANRHGRHKKQRQEEAIMSA